MASWPYSSNFWLLRRLHIVLHAINAESFKQCLYRIVTVIKIISQLK